MTEEEEELQEHYKKQIITYILHRFQIKFVVNLCIRGFFDGWMDLY